MEEDKKLEFLLDQRSIAGDVQSFDEAMKEFIKYRITFDGAEVRRIRDGLLKTELDDFRKRLRGLNGIVLIKGPWRVVGSGASFVLERGFYGDVTNAPGFSAVLESDQLDAGGRQVLSDNVGLQLEKSVFGTVVGMRDLNASIVRVRPIAVF